MTQPRYFNEHGEEVGPPRVQPEDIVLLLVVCAVLLVFVAVPWWLG